ncbi:hypothetical protein [Enterovirga sp.]|uniref:head-tail connector protein n=1 Tax=Enterovirga sp. TaxID=2026350 RepID=UPI002C741EF2|nr:hypothetical protein [Enterovirga sp.]HMO29753.1 hypothetical protein [Enterovirga sp.]
MNPIALAGPAVEPIPLAQMKSYLRLDGEDEDDLVEALVMAARVTVERHARLLLISQSWRLTLAAWPAGRTVRLPLHPILGIDEVRIAGEGDSPTIVPPGLYRLDSEGDVDRLVVDESAPAPTGRSGRIEIDVACGFGGDPASVPQPLILAMSRLVAHWFEHRGDEPRPGGAGLPADVAALVAPFARPRLA